MSYISAAEIKYHSSVHLRMSVCGFWFLFLSYKCRVSVMGHKA